MRILLLPFLLLVGSLLFGQNDEDQYLPTISISLEEGAKEIRSTHYLQSQFSKFFKGKLLPVSNGLYQFQLDGKKGKVQTIEGMDTKSFLEISFVSELINQLTGDKIWSSENIIKGKASSPTMAESDATKGLLRNENYRKEMLESITEDFTKIFGENCNSTLSLINSAGSIEELENYLALLAYFQNSPCKELADTKAELIIANLDKINCSNTIQELTIKIESAHFNKEEVLRKLLNISPKASCAQDAIALAKRMGDQLNVKESKDAKSLENYIQIMVNPNQTARSNYRQLYWKEYYRNRN